MMTHLSETCCCSMHPMHFLRRNRRLGGWLLQVVRMALLPLRGFAEAGMHLGLDMASAGAVSVGLPCHGTPSGPVTKVLASAAGVPSADADLSHGADSGSATCAPCVDDHRILTPGGCGRLLRLP